VPLKPSRRPQSTVADLSSSSAWDARDALRIERRISATRPQPPSEHVGEDVPERFVPDLTFAEWIRGTFIDASGPLANPEHEHLFDAKIGVLWTNCINVTKMRNILGTAEIPQTMGGAWKRGRAEQQLRDWFETDLDFLLTFYAPEVGQLDDRAFCALVEHELMHCGQAVDNYGSPRFDRETGRPIFGIRGHDVEEFTGIVERYGATSPDVAALVRAANRRPLVGEAPISIACGTCAKAVA
jgi:hypothetical protein